jgi:hypothetical protein
VACRKLVKLVGLVGPMHVEHHRTFKLDFIIKGKVLCVLCSAIIEDDVRAPDDALAARL